jgi:hypothetical protein
MMSLNVGKIAIASAVGAGLLWILCSVFVMLLPGFMMQMTAHMIHGDLSQMNWTLSWAGVFLGLLGWAFFASVTGGIIAAVYNWLSKLRSG